MNKVRRTIILVVLIILGLVLFYFLNFYRDFMMLKALNEISLQINYEYQKCIDAAKESKWSEFVEVFDEISKKKLDEYKFYGEKDTGNARAEIMSVFSKYYFNIYELQRRRGIEIVKEKNQFKIRLLIHISEMLS